VGSGWRESVAASGCRFMVADDAVMLVDHVELLEVLADRRWRDAGASALPLDHMGTRT